jgi:predicted Zn-dependent protease
MTTDESSQAVSTELNSKQFFALQSMSYTFLQHQKYQKAGALLKTLNQFAPDNQQVLFSLAFVLLKVGHTEDAQALIAPFFNRDSDIPPVLRLLQAKLLMAKGQPRDAAIQLEHYTN